MNHLILSQCHKSILYLNHYLLHLLLWQLPFIILANMTCQIGMFTVFKNEIQVATCLLRVNELNDVFVLDDREDIKFEMNSLELLLGNVLERYFFNGVFGFVILFLSLKNNRVRAFPNGFDQQIRTYFGKLFFVMVTFLHRYFYTIQYYLLNR